MSASRTRKVLIAALTISLLLHLVAALYARWPAFMQPHQEPEIVTIRHMTIAHVVPHTPPPTPVPTPRVRSISRAHVTPPHLTTHSGKTRSLPVAAMGSSAHTAKPAGTPLPVPTTTAGNSCLHTNSAPSVVGTPVPADIPAQARTGKINGTAAVVVQLDPQGSVTAAAIAQTSGSAALDAVAIEMAKSAIYTPELVACKPVAAAYTFTVKFVAW